MAKPPIRCAIYVRKSSEEGLKQDFNSLDAQYEACAAYIASQRHEGWRLVRKRYADGGVSGASLKRPGLEALLADMAAGQIERIVVYKIDRLTRSLADFARLMEQMDMVQCSFVSVTQSFNTSSSMGRLTLNVLLSFAQFERELTGERIRDKIAASKKKGLWMGGNVPLGYDSKDRRLVVNAQESAQVRQLFALYMRLGSLRLVQTEAQRRGICSKYRHHTAQRTGGQVMSQGQIHHILTNPVYIGKLRHRQQCYAGQHKAIVPAKLWAQVQAALQAGAARQRGTAAMPHRCWLIGKGFDDTGDRLTPSSTHKAGRIFRYYVSNRLIKQGKDTKGWRLSATALEQAVLRAMVAHLQALARTQRLLASADIAQAQSLGDAVARLVAALQTPDAPLRQTLLKKLVVTHTKLRLQLCAAALAQALGRKVDELGSECLDFAVPMQLRRRGVETRLVIGAPSPAPERKLQAMLARAHGWARQLQHGTTLAAVAQQEGISAGYIRRHVVLAFLSPKIQRAIVQGTQPPEWSLQHFITRSIPLTWRAQEKLFPLDATNFPVPRR